MRTDVKLLQEHKFQKNLVLIFFQASKKTIPPNSKNTFGFDTEIEESPSSALLK